MLHRNLKIISTDRNRYLLHVLWSTRSLVISTLVNSHLFIGQFDPWSIRTSTVSKSTRSSVFFARFRNAAWFMVNLILGHFDLVNSHRFIGQFDPWSIHTAVVSKSTRSSVFFAPFSLRRMNFVNSKKISSE